MSYTYLLEQGEESSAASFSDIPPSVLSRLNLTAEKSYSKDNGTASCPSSQSGTMFAPSTANLGAEKLMSSAGDSLAKTFQAQGGGQESQANEADCGQKWPESLAKYDQITSSWRTHQCLLFEDLTECLEIFPRWGMMQNGELWELTCSEPIITVPDGGWLPTPTCADAKNAGGRQNQYDLSRHAREITGKRLSVHYSEWMMDWPVGWTDITPLEMDKFQLWLQAHSEFLARDNEMI
jgi:hypothetical protein